MSEASYTKNQTAQDGWEQALALPRLLKYKDHHIYQIPIPQLKSLRHHHDQFNLQQKFHKNSLCFEMIIHFLTSTDFHMHLREDCYISYNCQESLLTLTMYQCGDGREKRSVIIQDLYKLQIFSDISSLEIFINDGYYTMSTRIFGNCDDIIINKVNAQADFYELLPYQIEW